MSKAKVFEYVIICNPKAKKDANGNDITEKPSLLDDGKFLAKDEKEAQILVARKIPAAFEDRLDEVEIGVRAF